MLIHECLDPADAGPDVHTDPLLFNGSDNPAFQNRLCGCRHRELGIHIAVQDIHFFHVCARIKISYFRGYLYFVVRSVDFCDRRDP